MIEIKYGIFDRVVYLNTSTLKFETGKVADIRVMPTGISKDENGEDILDSYDILYKLDNGIVLTSAEVYGSEEQARERIREALFAS